MLRIRDTPVPYPYLLILNVATFIFVYSTPFLYNTGIEGRYLGVQLLVIAYYGTPVLPSLPPSLPPSFFFIPVLFARSRCPSQEPSSLSFRCVFISHPSHIYTPRDAFLWSDTY